MADGKTGITKMRREYDSILKDLEILQSKMHGNGLTQTEGEQAERLIGEADQLKSSIDRYEAITGAVTAGRELRTTTMPDPAGDRKAVKRIRTTPGHLFVGSKAFRDFRASGAQNGFSGKVDVKDLRGGIVTLYGDEAHQFEAKAFDPATLSDLGTDALIPEQRDPDLVRGGGAEVEMLTIRDVMPVLQTGSDAIKYVRYTVERGAESQDGRGSAKPYLRTDFTTATVSVETIAVLSKVTEQDVDDAPRLVGIINGEMRLDIRVEEERQLLHGAGASGEIQGLYSQGVEGNYEFNRAEVGDTLVDTVRRMKTSLRNRRVMPNATLIHPIDWEDIELQKGSDNHYIWALIADIRGPRIWSMRVVESDAMENPDTGERRILMGDFVRGASLYDRHDVRLAVGYVDDDFARNLRTLRAEERLALAIKRPWAFEYVTTEAAS